MISITDAQLHCDSSLVKVCFDDNSNHFISFELLRIYSPMACKVPDGHQQPRLVTDKAFVRVDKMTHLPKGGLTITFDDGHFSGIFEPHYLLKLCQEQDSLWCDYLARFKAAQQWRNNTISAQVLY
ncbi:gamma-butyrobetaine hydroxylase-like domain-containing protein [Psychrobium sp. 1_MG-2023]|uniref:gamma-butyrobetaine hydroxylase-like domain-containing protein n=1 Tax=Psychrobium sp. 1_MG-2023 TaxID=3062624 RepID=UPI0026A42C69|nr:gamma-butyrobetaine hydroxylase-like domain-containing protein [Psychrobium sp. 1_MG-2023]MDP2562519.1 gamma-butyrobetaine hydroxylase-like domain-containing protein [Psychrobium sp. 1_MG-2023]